MTAVREAEVTQFDIISSLPLQVISVDPGLFITHNLKMEESWWERMWAKGLNLTALRHVPLRQRCDTACTAPGNVLPRWLFSVFPPHHMFPHASRKSTCDVFFSEGTQGSLCLTFSSRTAVNTYSKVSQRILSLGHRISSSFLSLIFFRTKTGRESFSDTALASFQWNVTFSWLLLWQACLGTSNSGKILLLYWTILQLLYQHRLSLSYSFSVFVCLSKSTPIMSQPSFFLSLFH